jgi:hypothetical protein
MTTKPFVRGYLTQVQRHFPAHDIRYEKSAQAIVLKEDTDLAVVCLLKMMSPLLVATSDVRPLVLPRDYSALLRAGVMNLQRVRPRLPELRPVYQSLRSILKNYEGEVAVGLGEYAVSNPSTGAYNMVSSRTRKRMELSRIARDVLTEALAERYEEMGAAAARFFCELNAGRQDELPYDYLRQIIGLNETTIRK